MENSSAPRFAGDDDLSGIVPDLAELVELLGVEVVEEQVGDDEGIAIPMGKVEHVGLMPRRGARPVRRGRTAVQGVKPMRQGEPAITGANFQPGMRWGRSEQAR